MSKKVLIVEDDKLSMKLETDVLQAHGYSVLQSFDGKDILQFTREQHPDLIIMDIRLPKVSGLEHIKALKADDGLKGIPVLVVTAFAMEDDKEMFFEAGSDDYLAKPISIPNFLETVEKLIK